MTVAGHSRVMSRDQAHRQPKHALPSTRRAQGTGIRSPKTSGRHTANPATSNYAVVVRTSITRATSQRVIRRLRPELIFYPIATFGTVFASTARYLIGAGRHGALFIVLSVCAISASGVIAAPHIWSTGRPQMPATGHSAPPVLQHNSVHRAPAVDGSHPIGAPPTSIAPVVISPPRVSQLQSIPAAPAQSDPAHDVQDLPPAQADPELESALSDLDKQAELDESMRRQRAPGQQSPVVVNPVPSPAPPDGPPPSPLRPGP